MQLYLYKLKPKDVKRIKAGPFVLYISDEEWNKIIEDEMKTLGLKPGVKLREQMKKQEKAGEIPPNKMYYDITYEKLEKLFEEIRIKVFGK